MSAFDPPDPSLRGGAEVDPDPDAPVIIGVAFETATRAQEYLLAMSGLRNAGKLDLKDAVVVSKKEDGKVSVTETIDPTPVRAAASGAMWTGLLGLIVGGPIGWLAGLGVGAGVGAVTAKVIDLGIPDEWVRWFKQTVADRRGSTLSSLSAYPSGWKVSRVRGQARCRVRRHGYPMACIRPGAAQAKAEWLDGGQACVCFVCWDEKGGCYAVLVPRQGDGVTPPWSPKGEEWPSDGTEVQVKGLSRRVWGQSNDSRGSGWRSTELAVAALRSCWKRPES